MLCTWEGEDGGGGAGARTSALCLKRYYLRRSPFRTRLLVRRQMFTVLCPWGSFSLQFTTEAGLVSGSAFSSYWLRWVIKMILPTLGHVNLFTSCWLALLHYDRFVNEKFTANTTTTSSSYYDVPQRTHSTIHLKNLA